MTIAPQLATQLAELHASLRAGQQQMAQWQSGELAVSAVPGAGKSTGMAVAAVITIANNQLSRQRQLVVVTFTRSAASNIRRKIRKHLQELRLPQSAFTVNTLHGLAFSIASSHAELSGFSAAETQIISEPRKLGLIKQAANRWLRKNPRLYEMLLEGRGFDGEDAERLRRQTILRTEVLPALAREAIATAKSAKLSPDDLRYADAGEILEVAAGLYETYQSLLHKQGMIDYDDMILGALRVLAQDSVQQYWQERVFAVFEDEAQDSSPLQTKLLEQLAVVRPQGRDAEMGGDRADLDRQNRDLEQRNNSQSVVNLDGANNQEGQQERHPENQNLNLIRVGDPNQAINSTFTNADPRFFNQFCDRAQSRGRLVSLDQAGRSSSRIMASANQVLDWVNSSTYAQPEPPFRQQHIRAVDPGDPQPNANPAPLPSRGNGLEINFPPNINHTVRLLYDRAQQLLAQNPELSMAVLVRQHNQGRFVCEELENFNRDHPDPIRVYDVEQRDRRSRVPEDMLAILQFLDRPHSPDNLKAALRVLSKRQIIKPQDLDALASLPEQFLYPTALDPNFTPIAIAARHICTGLLRAKLELPPYNLIAFIALTLRYDQGELATADKLSDRLSSQLEEYNLAAMVAALQDIVTSESFEAVEDENLEDRYTRSGQLTVISMHKAKGLDWDVVFMPFLHKRIIPGELFQKEAVKFLGEFTLPEVARAQIRAMIHGELIPDPTVAWSRCQSLKQAEEFRLLYVGMTRAKRLLWLSAARSAPFSWNNRDNLTDNADVCPALKTLVDSFPDAIGND
ncbi:UvrD/REP helicase [Thalassoporum mexicanum PCC 7367]|uniref:ATP-dependent helicase n=1 Tax=Thalassoporum mexicanum TaxID=3457544 RepID=UPI00029FAF3E|nr:ATP-dependent helicase [Pseudanabaena sp. PCC 7367]AFY68351.1 UvrD/REP helicase [Pseudanabaena sp. PCC 7367]